MPGQHTETAFECAIEQTLLSSGGFAQGDPDAFDREREHADKLARIFNCA